MTEQYRYFIWYLCWKASNDIKKSRVHELSTLREYVEKLPHLRMTLIKFLICLIVCLFVSLVSETSHHSTSGQPLVLALLHLTVYMMHQYIAPTD